MTKPVAKRQPIERELPTRLPALQRQGVELIQWYQRVEESKTEILKSLAEVVVRIRSQFIDPDTGQPDWRGKSWEYRQFIGEMYEKAGIPPDSKDGIQASLRYHVGNALREIATADQLKVSGMLPTTPRERMSASRSEARAIYHALVADSTKGDLKTRVQRWGQMVEAAAALSTRLAAIEVAAVPKRDARHLLRSVEEAQARLDELREQLRDRIG